MPEHPAHADQARHVMPFVYEEHGTKALHFSLAETQSSMRVDEPDALHLDYTRTMMGFLLFQPAPRDIAMIGLGGGSLAKFCYRHLPLARIEVVEINPHVIRLRDEFRVPKDDERFTVVPGDGAQFVRYHPDHSDVLLVDGFDPGRVPPALCSQRFYDDCHAALRPGGIMVVNLHAGCDRFDLFMDRIRHSFDGAVLLIHGIDLANSIVFARKGPHFESGTTLASARRPTHLDDIATEQLQATFSVILSALAASPR